MHRRQFLASLTALPLLARAPRAAPVAPVRLRVALGSGAPAGALAGATLGAEEAGRAAALLGGEVVVTRDADPTAHAYVGGWAWRDRGPDAPRAGRETADDWVRDAGPVLLIVAPHRDDDRNASPATCPGPVFAIAPSDAMRRDALAMAGATGAAGHAVAWHHGLETFGAAQLNDRFRARFGAAMDEDAWLAWFAIKTLAEAALRAGSAEPAALAAYLAHPATRFDGHKGRALSFRPWDHRLRQPLYVVRDGAPVEMPPRGAAGTVAEQLDRLGVAAADRARACG